MTLHQVEEMVHFAELFQWNAKLRFRDYDGKKVYSVNVRDVDYIEWEHFPKKPELVKMQQKIQQAQQLHKLDHSVTRISQWHWQTYSIQEVQADTKEVLLQFF